LRVPSSKSLANRVLILAALSEGSFRISGDFAAEDIQLMIQALKDLGIQVKSDEDGVEFDNDLSWRENNRELELHLGNSGTCVRFLATLVALRKGDTVLTGKQRLKERPIGDLVDALRSLEVKLDYLENDGYLPLRVYGNRQLSGGKVTIKGDTSSQFITSLLLSSPAFEQGIELEIQGDLISLPYIALTTSLLESWGVPVKWEGNNISVGSQQLSGKDYEVEGDASAAVYWWGLAFLQGCTIDVENIPEHSIQGDRKFKYLLDHLQKKKPCSPEGYDFDMNHMPDASLMLMAIAPLLDHPVMIRGIGSLRVKETDRIEAMKTELGKLGVRVDIDENWMKVYPLDLTHYDYEQNVQIETYDDHRIAMSLTILGTRLGNLEILDPDCVNKTYPHFWIDLKKFE